MNNIKLILEYDGTNYQGFEKKNSEYTISYKLASAIRRLTGEEVRLFPAVKTEPGVHAHMQTVNFYLKNDISPESILSSLNKMLPQDIAIRKAYYESDRFCAPLLLESCTYRCIIDIADIPDIFQQKYAIYTGPNLDIISMKQAAAHFVGTHDFAGYSAGKQKKSTIRTISELTLSTNEWSNKLFLTITADSFLRYMPQLISGALLRVGLGELSAADILAIFDESRKCGAPLESKAFHLTDTTFKLS